MNPIIMGFFNKYKEFCMEMGIIKWFFAYKSIIEYIYIFYISVWYPHLGLIYNPDFKKYMISCIFLVALVYCSPKKLNRPSDYLFFFLLLFIGVPIISFFWLKNMDILFTFSEVICFVFIYIFKEIVFKIRLKRKIDYAFLYKFFNVEIFQYIFLVYVIISLYCVYIRGGIDLRALNFDAIYLLRREEPGSLGIFGYWVNWCVRSIGPFLFAYFCIKKEYGKSILVVFLQIILYLTYGYKAFLIASCFMVFIYWSIYKYKKIFLKFFFVVFNSTLIFGYIVNFLGVDFINKLIVFRTLFIPVLIQFQYYDFFSRNSYMFFSEGSIGKLIGSTYSYGDPIGFVITRYFYGTDVISNSNTGVFSYAYADCGFWGMLICAIILGIMFAWVDKISNNLPVYVPVTALSYTVFSFNDTGILQNLNTGGIWLTFIFLWFLNNNFKINKTNMQYRKINRFE